MKAKTTIGVLAGLIIALILGGALYMWWDCCSSTHELERAKASADEAVQTTILQQKLHDAQAVQAGQSQTKPLTKNQKKFRDCVLKAVTPEQLMACSTAKDNH